MQALTEEQKQEADRLLLTYTEYTVALKTHIQPETYAKHKREMQADRDAWDAKMETMGAALTDHLRYAVRRVELPPEDGG
jgi:hypothetical protein